MGLRLAPGEQVRVRTRSHPRALTGPVLRLMLIALATGYVQGFLARTDLPQVLADGRSWLVGLVWALAALALFLGCVRPAWRWLTRSTLLTTRRIIQRAGPGSSRERALHLLSVYDVRLRQKRGQRMAKSGHLTVHHGSGGSWVLAEMPEAVRFRDLILREVGTLRHEIALQGGFQGGPVHAPVSGAPPATAEAHGPGPRPTAGHPGFLGGRGWAHRG